MGDWLKTIINRKKTTEDRTRQVKGSASHQPNGKLRSRYRKESNKAKNSNFLLTNGDNGMNIEEIAAIRIQTAFRRLKAGRTLYRLKGMQRLKVFTSRNSVRKQTINTMYTVQSWSQIQAQIRARRASMITEGHIRHKKQESQLKLEAKLQELEVEWNGGSETKEEIITRIQQWEEAAVKRERAMAYAFSHQWRANSGWNQGPFLYQLAQGNWGWSWVENWIAARPWETRLPAQPDNLRNSKTKSSIRFGKTSNLPPLRIPSSAKHTDTNTKDAIKKLPHSSKKETTKRGQNLWHVSPPGQKNKNAKMKQELLPIRTNEVAS